MTKKQTTRIESTRALPSKYLTVDYPPPDHGSQVPVRAGTRKPTSSEVEGDRQHQAAGRKED